MRVLLTTDTVGGIWTFTRELTTGLLSRGNDVALVSVGREPSRSQQRWTSEIKRRYGASFRYEASQAPLEWMDHNASAYSDAEGLLLRLIDQFKAEIVHSSQFCFGALPVDIPKVVTAHSDVLSWAEVCRPGGIGKSDWLLRYMDLVSSGIAGTDVLVTPTRWMRDAFKRNFPASATATVIQNGRTLPADKGGKGRRLQAVTMGRVWDEAKGLAVLSEGDSGMPVLVIGEASFEGKRAPKSKTLEYLGVLDEDEVLDVLRVSSLYLATSIYEPFGLAPLEAALCGCGVVARDIASLREVWGSAAEYFTDGEGLSKLISRLCDCPKELEAFRHRSRKRALELSAARMIDGYIAQYEALLPAIGAHEEAAAYAS